MAYRLRFRRALDAEGPERGRIYEYEAALAGKSGYLLFKALLSPETRRDLQLRGENRGVDLSEESRVDCLMREFALVKLERLLANGLPPSECSTSNPVSHVVTAGDFAEILSLNLRKDCEYQKRKGRDYYCSATTGPLLATTPASCRECVLPDGRILCSQFCHARSGLSLVPGEVTQQTPTAQCNLGKFEVEQPARCRPGANECWERIVEPAATTSSRRYSASEFVEALDFLNATWSLAFGKKCRLLNLRRAADIATLMSPCRERADFVACLSALDDIIKSLKVSDELLSDTDRAKKEVQGDQTCNRLNACISGKVPDAGYQQVGIRAIGLLRLANKVRVALQHSGRAHELPEALAGFGLSPTDDWPERWAIICSRVTEALIDLRRSINSLLDEQDREIPTVDESRAKLK